MNILFYLLPKQEIDFCYNDWSVRQALEKMRAHRYSMIPILDKDNGKYLRSITDGDLLRAILDMHIGYDELAQLPLSHIPSRRDIKAVSVMADEKDLISTIVDQNYVPVIDDQGVFIGIVTRKKILSELLKDQNK